jgi:lysophospholipase L1-like esterase
MGNFYKRTDLISIPLATTYISTNFTYSNGSDGCAFYDINKNYISGCRDTIIGNIPDNAKYIALTNYDSSYKHENKTISFIINPTVKSASSLGKVVTFGDSHVERGLWQSEVLAHFNVVEHENLGVGSSTVANNSSATVESFIHSSRINAIKSADPDTIIIIGGTNDVHLNTPIGSMESTELTTFYGAYKYLIETLLAWKPELNIFIATTPQGTYDTTHTVSYEKISESIKEIGNHYSIPVVDIFGRCGINKKNITKFSDDSIHYNQLGNDRVAKLMISTISNSYI